eukprot:g7005.t1
MKNQALDRQFHVGPVSLGNIPSTGQIPHTTPITANTILAPMIYAQSHPFGGVGSGHPTGDTDTPSDTPTASGPSETAASGPANSASGASGPPAASGPNGTPPTASGPSDTTPTASGPNDTTPAASGPNDSTPTASGPNDSASGPNDSALTTGSGSSGASGSGDTFNPNSSNSDQQIQPPPPPPPQPDRPDLDDASGMTGMPSESGPVGQSEQNDASGAAQEEADEINNMITADESSREALTTLREKHDSMMTHLYNMHSKMMVARATEDHDEVRDTLLAIQRGLTGLEVTEKEQKFMNRVAVERVAKAKEEAHKTKLAALNKKEKEVALKEALMQAKSTHERRCLQWTERVAETEAYLNKAFKAAMVSSTVAQQGAAANQNDQITQYQLKWSLQAINEVKCTLKLLLGLKKNKLMHCRLVRTANVAFLKMNNTMMPPYETPGLLSDKTIAHLSLTRARANEKTKVAREAAEAVKTAVQKSGLGKVKNPPQEVDKETGGPTEGKETTEMMFERIMGRPLNLKWKKPAFPKPGTLDSAVTGCLGGKCILTPIDAQNDMEGKKLARG